MYMSADLVLGISQTKALRAQEKFDRFERTYF
jgi:hypothetical protein